MNAYCALRSADAEAWVLHDAAGLMTDPVPGHDTVFTQFSLQFTHRTFDSH